MGKEKPKKEGEKGKRGGVGDEDSTSVCGASYQPTALSEVTVEPRVSQVTFIELGIA